MWERGTNAKIGRRENHREGWRARRLKMRRKTPSARMLYIVVVRLPEAVITREKRLEILVSG